MARPATHHHSHAMSTSTNTTYTMANGYVGSTVARNMPEVAVPAPGIPGDRQVFPRRGSDVPDCAFLKRHFFEEGRLSEAQVLRIVSAGTRLLRSEPNLLALKTPITICGDIHGQYYDLMKLFEVAESEPPAEAFLFLGDYVDRGCFSIECFLYLVALKVAHPDRVFLLRGNHECRHLTAHFTFRLECHCKYSLAVYEAVMGAFDCLPLAATVNGQFFCVHGGLSPALQTLADIDAVDRFQDPPRSGLMCDLLWSDPSSSYGAPDEPAWAANASRRCSHRFGLRAVQRFLEANGLLCVVRGHEAQDAGYRLYDALPGSDFPSLLTVFSAPNYVDVYKNKGALVKYDGATFNIRQFQHAPHPFCLPKFLDAFDWSLPFVGEKVADLLARTLRIPHLGAQLGLLTPQERARMDERRRARARVLRRKVLAVERLGRILRTVRTERETVDELMGLLGTRILPHRYLSLGAADIRALLRSFADAKRSDCLNEMRPPLREDTSHVDDPCSVSSLASPHPPPPPDALAEINASLCHAALQDARRKRLRPSRPPPP